MRRPVLILRQCFNRGNLFDISRSAFEWVQDGVRVALEVEAMTGTFSWAIGGRGTQVRRDVFRYPAQTKTVKGTAQPVGHLAVQIEVDFLPEYSPTFEPFAFNRKRGSTTGELALAFGQTVRSAEVADDLA